MIVNPEYLQIHLLIKIIYLKTKQNTLILVAKRDMKSMQGQMTTNAMPHEYVHKLQPSTNTQSQTQDNKRLYHRPD